MSIEFVHYEVCTWVNIAMLGYLNFKTSANVS